MEPKFTKSKSSSPKSPTSPLPREDFTEAVVDDPPKFDLESYLSNYEGRTRFTRLYFIGTRSSYLATEALKLALVEARSGKDVKNYQKALEALVKVAPSETDTTLDKIWVEQTLKSVKADTDRLEHELKGYKNNLIKESIRMGNEDLGYHYHQIGDLSAASKAYSRMRDYCTTTSHVASMLFKNINVAVDRGDWLAVQSNVYRLRNLQFKPEDETKNKAKMWASLGLSQLATGAYFDAAMSFVSTDPNLGDNYKEIISANDIAVYGGLCAMASMDRSDLVSYVLENKSFRNFLELEPHIRRAVSYFCSSKFRPCLEILESYRGDYLLDIYLHNHVHHLYSQIRTKAILQYIVPYNRIALRSMANVFSPKDIMTRTQRVTEICSTFLLELLTLIQEGILDAQVDLERDVLISRQKTIRYGNHQAALDSLCDYMDTAHLHLVHLNILHAGLDVPDIQQCTSDSHFFNSR
uniref:COP9 signalosome complex subunit 1 n=1 Tax=Coccidioides posadasii RMSCC 3488 TaxID=454284 RepID=A0A0J6INW8_COCPO|nr:G protein pathway suppressor 1 [Coccidioides posadasii RMSCC 3488]